MQNTNFNHTNSQTLFTTSAKMGRQFFVGGNFKMNGSVDTIKGIVNNLNQAKVDSNVGMET